MKFRILATLVFALGLLALPGYAAALEKPQNLIAVPGPDGITLTWDAPASTADIAGYHVQRRKAGPTSLETIASTSPAVTTYLDSTAEAGKRYIYRVRAYSADEIGPLSLPDQAKAQEGSASATVLDLQTRVRAQQILIDDLQGQISTLRSSLAANAIGIATNTASMAANAEDIASIATNAAGIATNATDIPALPRSHPVSRRSR